MEPIPSRQFQILLKEGPLEELSITDNYINGTLKKALPDGRLKFATTRVDPSLAEDLAQYAVRFNGVVESTIPREILSWVVPSLVFVGIRIFAIRKFAEKQGLGD